MCDRDCFNCKYPDCILDEVSSEERKVSNRMDAYAKDPDGEEKREKNLQYYYKNKKKKLEYFARYYQKNKEKISAYKKKWYQENRERIREKKRKAKERMKKYGRK